MYFKPEEDTEINDQKMAEISDLKKNKKRLTDNNYQ